MIENLNNNNIFTYYDTNPEKEWDRLIADPYHLIEYNISIHYLNEYLPPFGNILDAGSGPGRYSIYLTQKGYSVTMLDISPKVLELGKQKIIEFGNIELLDQIIIGNISNLSMIPDDYFDSSIALGGVLSHVNDSANRDRAIKELSRVTRSNGKLIFSVFNRLGQALKLLSNNPESLDLISKFMESGDYFRISSGEDTNTHFFTPDELRKIFNNLNLKSIVPIQGITNLMKQDVNHFTDNQQNELIQILISNSSSPEQLSTTSQMLAIIENNK